MNCHLVYGPWLPECLDCEGEIPLKRLKSVPYAKYCRDCQERQERDGITVAFRAGVMAESEKDEDIGRERGWHVRADAVFTHQLPKKVA